MRYPRPMPATPNDPSQAEITVSAPSDAAPERIDRFLAIHLPDMSRSRLKSLIESGAVHRDGQRVRGPAEMVRPGSLYRLRLPALAPATPIAQHIAFPILFEDDDLIVLDKPAGMVVHPAPGSPDGTLVNALLAYCGENLPGIGGEKRPGIVHRLDKDTSGVMVVAKTEFALAALSALFAARDLERLYTALAWGVPSPRESDIEGAIGRDSRDRKRMAIVRHGGKPALTHYRTMATWHGAVTRLECKLATGRTHQIRVHLSANGHPIIGDPVYLRRIPAVAKSLDQDVKNALLDFPRQALHAGVLGFRHPRTSESLRFETPLPEDMMSLIDLLDHNS
ncbi:Ribosomal large subunit pseudouridine synthase D [Granulibacter bethesdensis]|nr:Ribosomal large subunit pseudouridine synthase D [Granulibacter bethesdensis]